jgi:hypothetical protein
MIRKWGRTGSMNIFLQDWCRLWRRLILPKFCNKYSRKIQGRTPSATFTLKMETVHSAEPYVNVYKITRPHNPECRNVHYHSPGPDSVVCIANCYVLKDPGSNPGRGKIFCPRPDRPRGPPNFPNNGYWIPFSELKCPMLYRLPPTPYLALRLKKD